MVRQLKKPQRDFKGLCWIAIVRAISMLELATIAHAQLPDAPRVAPLLIAPRNTAPTMQAVSQAPATSSESTVGAEHLRLSLADAEKMALKSNPSISVARLLALAQHQVVREAKSAMLPTANAAITAMQAEDASRVSAGSLTASRLFEHAGAGGGFTQLITDFGKTGNLVASSMLQEKAQNASALATTEDIIVATDQAFYDALQSQALLKVAIQNTSTRQTSESQISSYTKNNLKSTLDLSFADVNLSQAKLLQLDAQSNAESSMAALDAILGLDRQVVFELVEETGPLTAPPADVDQLVQLAMRQRPDLQALDLSHQAAVKFSHAERDLNLPSITALGTVGSVPIRPPQYYNQNWWGGIGVNMNIPIFDGFLFSAQEKEATIRAEADSEQTRALRDQIVRDVRTAWLTANTAYQSVTVTDELLKQANLALSLAQTRYQLGLSSIVELSQAQYQQTDAAIGYTNAQYRYRLALATLNYQMGENP
jgi:outer membrane protein